MSVSAAAVILFLAHADRKPLDDRAEEVLKQGALAGDDNNVGWHAGNQTSCDFSRDGFLVDDDFRGVIVLLGRAFIVDQAIRGHCSNLTEDRRQVLVGEGRKPYFGCLPNGDVVDVGWGDFGGKHRLSEMEMTSAKVSPGFTTAPRA